MSAQGVLRCPMGDNDAGASNVREYLVKLLEELWTEGEAFSGKRPFGNSSWEYELYTALVAAKFVPGDLDEDGYLDTFSVEAQRTADRLILEAIRDLGR